MNKKQIVVVGAVAVICGYLYLQPVKGLVKPKETRTNGGVAQGDKPSASNVTVTTVSAAGKTAIGAALTNRINDLENQLKNASSDAQRLPLQKQLADQWYADNQPAPAAFYYMEAGK